MPRRKKLKRPVTPTPRTMARRRAEEIVAKERAALDRRVALIQDGVLAVSEWIRLSPRLARSWHDLVDSEGSEAEAQRILDLSDDDAVYVASLPLPADKDAAESETHDGSAGSDHDGNAESDSEDDAAESAGGDGNAESDDNPGDAESGDNGGGGPAGDDGGNESHDS